MLATVLLAACSDGPGPATGPAPVASVTIISTDSVLSPMESSQFQAEILDTTGSLVLRVVTWSVSDTLVADVSSLGLLTARANGSVNVVAQVDGVRDSVPIRVTRSFTAISVGRSGACALGVDSTAYCWGYGPRGTTTPPADTSALSVVEGGLSWLTVDLGEGNTACGVTADHAAYCWGGSSNGIMGAGYNIADPRVPNLVLGGLSFDSVRVGSEHACGVTTTAAAWCWGANKHGEDGDSSHTARWQPAALYGGGGWRTVVANGYTTCGLNPAGVPYCWGVNLNGYLGIDSTDQGDILVPLPVQTTATYTNMVIGYTHQCALGSGGAAFCWGYNSNGQLGLGFLDSTVARTPRAVSGGHTFTRLSGGGYHSCGIGTDSTAWCWGQDTPTPTPVPGGHRFVQLDAAWFKSCGVTAGGAGYCWAEPGGTPVRVRDP